mgnify:CR=1 FL=1
MFSGRKLPSRAPKTLSHNGLDDSFCLAVGAGSMRSGKGLPDAVFPAHPHEFMLPGTALVFCPVVSVPRLNGVGAFLQNLLEESGG